MKNAAVLLLSLAFASAQDSTPETVKHLKSVTWDLNTHKLVWVVETGTKTNGDFVASGTARYEVSPDEARMKFADETRGFTAEEAASLHHLLDVLSVYCAESTVWWDQGKGVPIDNQNQTTPASPPDGKPVRVDQPQPKKKPFHISDSDMIAANRGR
jgi:hypothetical protein